MTAAELALEVGYPSARHALRPPPRLSLSDWAERHFYLSAESAAEPGRWKSLPYQRGILNAITDPSVTQVSVMKSARIGYTKCINAAVGYYMHQDPCPIMVVQPTIEDAQGYSKEEIAPMLRDCPELARLVPEPSTRDSNNTILLKKFPGGALQLVGANSARGFRRVSRKVLIFDEPDGYPVSAGVEGDPIQLGIRRTEYYWDRKIIAGSTPTIQGRSRIEQLFLAGDQRRYYVPCPDCGAMQVLQRKSFAWPRGKPELAVYVCIACGSEVEHSHKRDMVEAGEWRPGPHPQFPDSPTPAPFDGHASFHIWAAYSYSPNASWGQLFSEFTAATHAGPEHLKTYINTVIGEPWQDKGEAPEWHRLYSRRESYPIGSCPKGVLFLTAGVDVQKERLVYEIVGWGRDKRSWSIESGIIPGDTSDTAKGPWPALHAMLQREYPRETGPALSIAMLAVDIGFNGQIVSGWCRQYPMNRVIAVFGAPSAHVLIGSPSRVDVNVSGRRMKGGYKAWPISSSMAKSELYGWLALRAPTDEGRAEGQTDPPGYCHFPEYGEEFFRQLTAEQLVSKKHRGYTVFGWEQIPGRENHFLDARVYARCAAALAGLDRFKESDWAALERAVGEEPRVAAEVPGQTEPSNPEPAPAKPRWVQRRQGSWLRKDH